MIRNSMSSLSFIDSQIMLLIRATVNDDHQKFKTICGLIIYISLNKLEPINDPFSKIKLNIIVLY